MFALACVPVGKGSFDDMPKMERSYKTGGCDCWRVLISVWKPGGRQGARRGCIKRVELG